MGVKWAYIYIIDLRKQKEQLHYNRNTHVIHQHQSTNYQWPNCAIQGSHSSAVEDSGLVGCDTVPQGELFPMLHTTVFITLRTVLIIKANEMHYFSTLCGKELYVFRTDLLLIIRSLNTVFTAIGICHTSYVACLLARSGPPDFASRQSA
jgi:hypothetical protein